MTFTAPVADILRSLKAAGLDRLQAAAPDLDDATLAAVLEGAGAFASDVIAPLNRPGDLAGAKFKDGAVTAAPGYADAYRRFAADGWNSLSADPAHGGQGLPKAVEIAVFEMIQAASLAFGLCPMLTQAGIEALAAHGTPDQQRKYLPKLVSGEWTGTMNLTEPQAGTDLAAVAMRAEPDGTGGYRLYGQKIFITWGDHDATDNIVHLVLARTPDAPAGVKGISLFLTSKFAVKDDGSLGERLAVGPAGIEHKLGIHASPTCVMAYDGAQAQLVGEEGKGLAHMFTMMNAARLQVGVQGVAIAERAYQQALGYARERRQGRSAWTGQPAMIVDHPDVRRSLMLIKAKTSAARGVCLSCAVASDLSQLAPTEGERAAAKRREELLTPIAKAWSTDVGVWAASEGLQIHGGMGFIEETGAAQHYRDARILPIYEGTNGIQAMDLAGRKLSMDDGLALVELLDEIEDTAHALTGDLADAGARLSSAVTVARAAGAWLAARKGSPDALAGATAFLQLMGETTGGWMLAKAALAGDAEQGLLLQLFAGQVLAGAPALADSVMQGAEALAAWEPS